MNQTPAVPAAPDLYIDFMLPDGTETHRIEAWTNHGLPLIIHGGRLHIPAGFLAARGLAPTTTTRVHRSD